MRALAVVSIIVLGGCPKPPAKETLPLVDPVATNEGDRVSAMKTELENDIFESYDRDEPPELETGMLSPAIGGARIGVGPGDVLVAQELRRAPSRWPLNIDRETSTAALSKRLSVSFALDETAAWMSDEVSWRITMCGRIAVIPLRITGLYAHDGDRWVPVFEHVSFAHPPAPARDGQLRGTRFKSEVVSRDLADELSRVLGPVLSRAAVRDSLAISTGPEASLFGPDVDAEWQGTSLLGANLTTAPLVNEDRRVGTVGRGVAKSTIAYWVGNLVADLPARAGVPAGKARMRGSFVFERRKVEATAKPGETKKPEDKFKAGTNACSLDPKDCRWVLVQGQVSEPIDDKDLATAIFGTSIVSLDPLKLTCADGRTPTTGSRPAPAEQQGRGPGAAGSP